jgi:hypothetical protein
VTNINTSTDEMKAHYYITAKSLGLVTAIDLNDVPLIRDPKAQGIITDELINKWIAPVGNSITVSLAWPPRTSFQAGKARCEVSVFIADPQAEAPKPGQMLFSFKWPSENQPEVYPFTLQKEIVISEAPGTNLWKDAPEIREITPADKQSMVRLIENFRGALLRGDAEGAFEIMRYRYAEEALAENKDVEPVRNAVIEQYRWLLEKSDLETVPVEEAKLVFRTVGKNKVVWVSDGGSLPALSVRERQKGRSFGFEFYFAQIGGGWKVVR